MRNIKTRAKIGVSLFFLLSTFSLQANAEPIITKVNRVGDTVQLTINHSDGFWVGALPYVLKIGDASFRKSMPPSDGDINTLIFLIPSDAFDQLKDGDLMDMGYGEAGEVSANQVVVSNRKSALSRINRRAAVLGTSSNHQWTLGRFDKQQLLDEKK